MKKQPVVQTSPRQLWTLTANDLRKVTGGEVATGQSSGRRQYG